MVCQARLFIQRNPAESILCLISNYHNRNCSMVVMCECKSPHMWSMMCLFLKCQLSSLFAFWIFLYLPPISETRVPTTDRRFLSKCLCLVDRLQSDCIRLLWRHKAIRGGWQCNDSKEIDLMWSHTYILDRFGESTDQQLTDQWWLP